MSKNIVDALIEYANNTQTHVTFIPSRRQVEWNGGYVNNWTTETFTNYVKSKSEYIAIQRDHGGPGQGLHECWCFSGIPVFTKFKNHYFSVF